MPWCKVIGLAIKVCVSGISRRYRGLLHNRFPLADATLEYGPAAIFLLFLTTCKDGKIDFQDVYVGGLHDILPYPR